jgi:pyruvate dehydrogenase E2 component (dihydrolipoamide acetyltransferase)
MAVEVKMPQMGESIVEGTVTKWLKKPGEKVQRDEPLLEISTDKVDAEVPSPAAGVLKEIKVHEGQTVQINTVVALLDSDGAGGAAAAPMPAPAAQPPQPAAEPARRGGAEAPAAPPATAPTAQKPTPRPAAAPAAPPPQAKPQPQAQAQPQPKPAAPPAPAVPAPVAAESAAEAGEGVRSSPLVRRLAREHGVNLSAVAGTGEGGRVSKQDLLGYIAAHEAGAAAPAAAPSPAGPAAPAPAAPTWTGGVEIVPMSVMRKRIAEHMVMSKHTSPHVYTVFQVDMTPAVRARERQKTEFEARTGTRLTFMPFFAFAAVQAIKQFPIINSSVQGDSIVYKKDVNLGIAVALDWGLIVPVIKHAEEKNFLGLQRSINDLAERARTKKLSPDEVKDGTFSITNPGIYGGLFGLPVINQPQVAILGVGGIHKTPVIIDDAIAVRSVVHLTLSFDHRVIDGAVADQFMAAVKTILEGWNEPLM